jgi:hypothetical protein
MSVQLECIGCREIKTFPRFEEFPVCPKCREWEKKHLEELQQETVREQACSLCGYVGVAIDQHHIHGRKNSNETIQVCCNCHREIHKGVRSL